MVCLDDPATAKGLVRAGRRMTDRARIPWVVATVVTPAIETRGPTAAGAITDALQLAERLGAATRTLRADGDAADAHLDAARQLGATRLILGRTAPGGWKAHVAALIHPPLAQRLLSHAEGFEVTVLDPAPDRPAASVVPAARPRPRRATGRLWVRLFFQSLLATTAATLVAWPFRHILPVASLAVIYVAVLAVAMRQGTNGAIATSICSFLAYNFFFTSPYFSFVAAAEEIRCGADRLHRLGAFHGQPCRVAQAAGRIHARHPGADGNMYDFARKIASATSTDDVLWAAAAHIAHTLECHSLILMPREGAL